MGKKRINDKEGMMGPLPCVSYRTSNLDASGATIGEVELLVAAYNINDARKTMAWLLGEYERIKRLRGEIKATRNPMVA